MRSPRTPSGPTAADALAVNALGALLLGGGLHRDIDAELRGLITETLPRMSRGNPDMVHLATDAEQMLVNPDAGARRRARDAVTWQLMNILRGRAFEALARLQASEGSQNGEGRD